MSGQPLLLLGRIGRQVLDPQRVGLRELRRDPARHARERLLVGRHREAQRQVRRRDDRRLDLLRRALVGQRAQHDQRAVRVAEQDERRALGRELPGGRLHRGEIVQVRAEAIDEAADARRAAVAPHVVGQRGPAGIDDHVGQLAVAAAVLGVAVVHEDGPLGRAARQELLGIQVADGRGGGGGIGPGGLLIDVLRDPLL